MLSSSFNATDSMLIAWYVTITCAIITRPRPFAAFAGYLVLHLVVLASICSLAALSRLGRSWRFAHDWFPTLIFVAAFEEVARLSLVFMPHWQDPLILRVETAFFPVPPTEWLGQFHQFWLVELLEFGYFTFYWIMFVVGGVLYKDVWTHSPAHANDPHQAFRIWMDATVLGYLLCYIVFLVFPTEGPAHTLPRQLATGPTGPFHWLVLLIQHHAGVHGNAFPSAHIMASVVALLAAAKWKPLLAGWLAAPVLLMCVGAVYDRYHYASDIIAGALLGTTTFLILVSIRRANPASVA